MRIVCEQIPDSRRGIAEIDEDMGVVLVLSEFLDDVAFAYTACTLDQKCTLSHTLVFPLQQAIVNLSFHDMVFPDSLISIIQNIPDSLNNKL